MAAYLIHQQRVYNAGDTAHRGPSIPLADFYAGHNPPPPPPRAFPVLTQDAWRRQARRFLAAAHPHATPRREPAVPPAPTDMLGAVVRLQRKRGLR